MCVRTAGENARLNGVQEQFQVLVGDLSDQAEGRYDIITANIVAAAGAEIGRASCRERV